MAAPRPDSIPRLMYHKCYNILGHALTSVIKEIHEGQNPIKSQRTSLMVFANNPKKEKSKLVKDKQAQSLLNTDFKIASGLEAERHKVIMNHMVSNHQYAVGTNKRIQHAIGMA